MELHISKGINNKLENKNGIALTSIKSRFNSISILIYSQPMYIVKICCISFFFHFPFPEFDSVDVCDIFRRQWMS